MSDTSPDICAICGLLGADKVQAPHHWPGYPCLDAEMLVHSECEAAEEFRAMRLLSLEQRTKFLNSL